MPSDTRTPKTMRDRRSRPNRSVPKGWRGLGPWNTWAASIAVGENGATNAAKSPMAIMRRSAPHAPTKRGLRASERRGAATIARLAASEPRIEDRIEKVHGEVQDHEGGGEEQNHALDHRVVALEDRVEQQPPDAGQGEDVFDHDDAAHDVAELDAGDRDDGDQRVAERVVEGHPALGQPLARAVRTYSRPRTSSIVERDMRVIIAAVAVPSVSAGSAIVRRLVAGRCVNGTHWSDGIQPR